MRFSFFLFVGMCLFLSLPAQATPPRSFYYMPLVEAPECNINEDCFLKFRIVGPVVEYLDQDNHIFDELSYEIELSPYKYDLFDTDVSQMKIEKMGRVLASSLQDNEIIIQYRVEEDGEYDLIFHFDLGKDNTGVNVSMIVEDGVVRVGKSIPEILYSIEDKGVLRGMLENRFKRANTQNLQSLNESYPTEEACFERWNFKIILMKLCRSAYYTARETGGAFGVRPYTPIEIEIEYDPTLDAKILVGGALVGFGHSMVLGEGKKLSEGVYIRKDEYPDKVYMQMFLIEDEFSFKLRPRKGGLPQDVVDYPFKLRLLEDIPEWIFAPSR